MPDTSQSDGYHTFDELYEHRSLLYLSLMKCNADISWISKEHYDGDMFDGYFIAGMDLPAGQITYHLEEKYWELAVEAEVIVLEKGKQWDGHTSKDTCNRLKNWITNIV